jgi:hypothetical protein
LQKSKKASGSGPKTLRVFLNSFDKRRFPIKDFGNDMGGDTEDAFAMLSFAFYGDTGSMIL